VGGALFETLRSLSMESRASLVDMEFEGEWEGVEGELCAPLVGIFA
jgi:hypothetical protein